MVMVFHETIEQLTLFQSSLVSVTCLSHCPLSTKWLQAQSLYKLQNKSCSDANCSTNYLSIYQTIKITLVAFHRNPLQHDFSFTYVISVYDYNSITAQIGSFFAQKYFSFCRCNWCTYPYVLSHSLNGALHPQIHMYIELYTSFLFSRHSLFVSFNRKLTQFLVNCKKILIHLICFLRGDHHD
jgi:hypothetical protein